MSMKIPERGQLFLEDWVAQDPDESSEETPKNEFLPSRRALERDEIECNYCGDSGPCSTCKRGIDLAKAQGRPYRRGKR